MRTGATVVTVSVLLLINILARPSGVAVKNELELKMTVNKDIVPIGQQISFNLTLTNIGKKEVTVTFGTSQAFDLYYCTTTACYFWSDSMYFFPMVWEVTLRPGETFSETLQWNLYQYDEATGKFLQPELGTYYVWGECVGMPRTPTASPTTIKLVVPGDVNGDRTVDLLDLDAFAKAYGSTSTSPAWNPNIDINNDALVDIFDLGIVSHHWGESW